MDITVCVIHRIKSENQMWVPVRGPPVLHGGQLVEDLHRRLVGHPSQLAQVLVRQVYNTEGKGLIQECIN